MKAVLILAALSFAAAAQAKYELSCAQSELSVRWPSYESNSEYYVCSHLFGRQLTVACNPGEVFTFVLQSCTAPSRYIPAPALDFLPTAPPLSVKPNKDGYLTPIEIVNKPSETSEEEEEASPVQKEDSAIAVGKPNKPGKKPSSAAGKRPNAKKKKSTNSNSVTTIDENEPSKKKPRKPGKLSGKKKAAKKSGKQKTTAKKTPKKSGKKSKAVEKKQPKN